MVKSREKIGRQVLKAGMAMIGVSCLGAAVFAAPLTVTPRNKVASSVQEKTTFEPLARGPAITLAKAEAGADEDCVRVTRMTGPDGQVYATRGTVCH